MFLAVSLSSFAKELRICSTTLRDPFRIRIAVLSRSELRLVVVVAPLRYLRRIPDCSKVIGTYRRAFGEQFFDPLQQIHLPIWVSIVVVDCSDGYCVRVGY